MITIDGSEGEGGGQILRSALSLSMCTQQPFRITNIRAKREKPGLMRQHLTAVRAAVAICGGTVVGDEVGSLELTFRPGPVKPGDYSFFALTITIEHEAVTEVFTGFGEKGVSAETVAKGAAERARAYLAAPAAAGRHLADQLLLPMALAGGGEFTTLPVSAHFNSHAAIIEMFLGRRSSVKSDAGFMHVTV